MNGGDQNKRPDYFDRGAIFRSRNMSNENAPTHYCKLSLSKETLEKISKANGKIKIAGWLKDSDYGEYISIKISADDYQKEDSGRSKQSERSEGGAQKEVIDDDIPF